MDPSSSRTSRPTGATSAMRALLIGALALALPVPLQAQDAPAVDTLAAEYDGDLNTVAQVPEEGAQTSALAVSLSGDTLRAPAWTEQQVCDTGAAWLRLRIADLSLHGDDVLTLVPRKGDPLEFAGRSWEGRSFFTRAFEGECVRVRARLRHPHSRVLIDALQSSSEPLTLATTVVAAVGDICDSTLRCSDTAAVVTSLNPVKLILAGDNAYNNGTLTEYNNYYHPYYGPFKAKTHPAAGNHEYNTSGAAGYFDYFNGVGVFDGPAGPRDKGYYSVDVGDWHVVVLNSNITRGAGSAQEQWLRADLAASTKPCTLASWHHPRFTIGNYAPGDTSVQALYQALQDYKADVVIVGHDHNYQRWAPMTAGGTRDTVNGVRQFLVGTGGRSFYGFSTTSPNVESSNASTWGVLKLTLSPTDYAWEFLRTAGTFTDSGSTACKPKGTAADFSLSLSPASLSVQRGASATTTVTVASQGGFSAAVALSCGTLPAGVSCSFSPASVTPPANGSVTSTLTVSAGSTATTGSATVAVNGVSGALTRSANLALTVTAPTTPDFNIACSPASVSAAPGASVNSTCTVTSTGGFSSAVALSCTGLPAGVTCAFAPVSVTPPADGSVSSTLTISVAAGTPPATSTFQASGTSGATVKNAGITLTVTGNGGPQTAVYDATRRAPTCATVGISCDTGATLILGRGTRGPEPNRPNTINAACADGNSGTFHVDESLDRLKVSTVDLGNFAAGKQVRIEATVWAWSTPSSDKLDLYYAPNAASPSWTFITTLTPTAGGAQTLSATYTLPAGSLQAIRAQFRYQGSVGTCSTGGYNDRDDLVFAVQ